MSRPSGRRLLSVPGIVLGTILSLGSFLEAPASAIPVETDDFDPGGGFSQHVVSHPDGQEIRLDWPIGENEAGRLELDSHVHQLQSELLAP